MNTAVRFASVAARRGAFEAKTVIARYPALALPIARLRHGIPVGQDTGIVIEGFARTGTSFAVAAFDLAQDGNVTIACHVHAPAQLIEGARRGLPNLMIIREPEETVLSFVIRKPHLSIGQVLRGYVRFYEPLLPYRNRVVIGTFAHLTKDFGSVIDRVNERFSTSFARFEHTEENVRRCFQAIDEDYRRRLPEGEALERQVARPSEWRELAKDDLRASYGSREAAGMRGKAERVFGAIADVEG